MNLYIELCLLLKTVTKDQRHNQNPEKELPETNQCEAKTQARALII